MNWSHFKRIVRLQFIPFLAVLTMVLAACAGVNVQQLEGILKNIDTANGTIILTTKDGKTATINIGTNSTVNINGAPGSIYSLDPGSNVKVSKDDKGNAHAISANVVSAAGIISSIQGNQVTITPQHGNPVSVNVTSETLVRLESGNGTINDLQVGAQVEVKYDRQTLNAFKIYLNVKEWAEAEGTIASISGNNITITSQGKRGLGVTLTTDNATVIHIKDTQGTLSDLKVGDQIHAKFDPATMKAYRIEVQHAEAKKPPAVSEVKGTITSIVGSNITISTEERGKITLTTDNTTIVYIRDTKGKLSDLKVGDMVHAKYDQVTMKTLQIVAQHAEAKKPPAVSEIKGTISSIVGSNITISTEERGKITLTTDNTTIVYIRDTKGKLSDLKVGDMVHAKYDQVTMKTLQIVAQHAELKTP